LAVAACQNPAPPQPAATTQVVASAADRAREAVAKSDWKAAALLYREALATAPADVALHYGLAVAASHLDEREEARREFRWVVANASPDSQEYRVAKAWLAEAMGTTTTGTASTSATGTTTSRSATTASVERSGDSGLYGRVIWASEPNGPPTTQRMQLHLYGVANTATKDQRYSVRTDEEGRYEFKRIVAGPYKLTNRVAGRPNWRVRVEVESGRDTAFDLHPGNSMNVRDDFPE
jgi:hypothetical protein